jgi:hypothetical protein
MFNPIQFYESGKSRGAASYLLEIGGVSSTINTAALLADKMLNYPSGTAFSPSNILNFTIVGANIQCFLNADYKIKDDAYLNNLSITYYNDYGSCIETGLQSFLVGGGFTMILKKVYLKNAITIGVACFSGNGFSSVEEIILPNAIQLGNGCFANAESFKIIYIPRATNIGDTVLYNDVFAFSNQGFKVYAEPSMVTINSGGVEGDLAYVINTLKGTVNYVDNFTLPNPVNTLLIGTIYGTAIQLNFTPPTGSTNAIDYYECYANGVFKNKITTSGQYIRGLTVNTTYQFTVIAVDVFYNKSLVSNLVSVSTASSLSYQDSIVAYYKFQDNTKDSFYSNDGNGTAIVYENGLVGKRAVFNGTTSKIVLNPSSSFSFNNANNDLPFSLAFILNQPSSKFATIFSKRDTAPAEYQLTMSTSQKLTLELYSGGTTAVRFNTTSLDSVILNQNNIVCVTYDGSGLASGIKIYINNILSAQVNTTTGSYVKMNSTSSNVYLGADRGNANSNIKKDEFAVFKKSISSTEVNDIQTKFTNGQSLI